MELTLIERLQEVMRAMSWERSDLVRVSGESSSVVSQWLGRGSKEIRSIGKMQAAERLEAATGFCALWIAKGQGPKRVEQAGYTMPATPMRLPPSQTVRSLAALLDSLDDEARLVAAEDLGTLARAPDSARAMARLVQTLTRSTADPSSKRTGGAR